MAMVRMQPPSTLKVLERLALVAVLIVLTPLVWLWLLFDFRQLSQLAQEIEPIDETESYAIGMGGRLWLWFLRNIIARTFVVLLFPLIMIVGMCFHLLDWRGSDGNSENDIIW
jgi:hypothetical protein